MPFAHFQVPACGGQIEEDLNRFLHSHRVVKVERQFIAEGTNAFWLYCVEYLSGGKGFQGAGKEQATARKPIDYRDKLSPEDFTLYLKLKDWRKERAETDEVDAIYTIFTNAQMAEIAEKRCGSKAALGEVAGVGEKRIEKYGSTEKGQSVIVDFWGG